MYQFWHNFLNDPWTFIATMIVVVPLTVLVVIGIILLISMGLGKGSR